jgi:pyrroline-5-carboxylate reductase
LPAKLGIIGGGVMGEALLSRLLDRGLYPPQEIMVSDPADSRQAYLRETYGVQVTDNNHQVAAEASETLMLAVKPQVFPTVAAEFKPGATHPQACILSILAGTPLSQLEAAFPDRAVIRAMPNTPATVGAGMTAIAMGHQVQSHQREQAHQIFAAVGEVVEVPESLMDAVTGLSGSGPAFVAIMVEALADGGVAAGLPRAIAQKLALQTVRGTAELLHSQDLHPAVLKDRVTSPGGTTIAGVATLEEAGLRSALIKAVQAAYHRSQSLGQS